MPITRETQQGDPARLCANKGIDLYSKFDRCHPSSNTEIAFAKDIRVQWVDPEDLWQCRCECDDPSAPGAVIVAPIQGCSPGAFDDAEAGDRAQACQHVCGGTMCGDAPSC
ncbi:MAG: hypothetical protein HYZ28_06995 [Myxococcales bacterium]|nr:hypothetical protein [Myxococcales bacterium]